MKGFDTGMKILLVLVSALGLAFGDAKIGVMETAFGYRCEVESVRLAKESGYAGVQIHTGRLGKDGKMTISDPEIQKQFIAASKKHGVEICSLCAGAMNRVNVWQDGEARKNGLKIMTESLAACEALSCETLLFPFFGPSNFQDEDEILEGVAKFIEEILPAARKHGVTIGLESPVTYERVQELLKRLGNPKEVKMYYDTGNMGRKGEEIGKALRAFGKEGICEVHLKPKNGVHFGKDDGTDLEKLAATLDEIGYEGWLVFEQGGGVKKGEAELSKENLIGVKKLVAMRESVKSRSEAE